jgi:hypothetical protein
MVPMSRLMSEDKQMYIILHLSNYFNAATKDENDWTDFDQETMMNLDKLNSYLASAVVEIVELCGEQTKTNTHSGFNWNNLLFRIWWFFSTPDSTSNLEIVHQSQQEAET